MSGELDLLIVDDDADALLLAQHVFGECHARARIAALASGEAALDFLLARGAYCYRQGVKLPRCVLLDLKMPRLDGFDLLRLLKANPSTRALPVVILSCSTHEADIVRCYELGANGYLFKPLDFDEFRSLAQAVVRFWLC